MLVIYYYLTSAENELPNVQFRNFAFRLVSKILLINCLLVLSWSAYVIVMRKKKTLLHVIF